MRLRLRAPYGNTVHCSYVGGTGEYQWHVADMKTVKIKLLGFTILSIELETWDVFEEQQNLPQLPAKQAGDDERMIFSSEGSLTSD